MGTSDLVEFSPAILMHLIIGGYKTLKVENNGRYVLIEPIRNADLTGNMSGNNAYLMPIDDPKAIERTKEVLSLDIKFYINKHFIA